MHYSLLDKAGNLTIANAPVYGLRAPIVMHDIAITRNFSIALDMPLFIVSDPQPGGLRICTIRLLLQDLV